MGKRIDITPTHITDSDIFARDDLKNKIESLLMNDNIRYPDDAFQYSDYEHIYNYFDYYRRNMACDINTMCATFQFLIASISGMQFKIIDKQGYAATSFTHLWLCLVAPSGAGKTTSSQTIFMAFKKKDLMKRKKYAESLFKFKNQKSKDDIFDAFSEPKIDMPKDRSLIVQDITSEALSQQLNNKPRGVSLFLDEIIDFFGNMGSYSSNKSKADSEMSRFLSYFSGVNIAVNRKSEDVEATSQYVSLNMIGGIQNKKLSKIVSKDTIDNGLVGRLLFCEVLAKNRPRYRDDALERHPDVDFVENNLLLFSEKVEAFAYGEKTKFESAQERPSLFDEDEEKKKYIKVSYRPSARLLVRRFTFSCGLILDEKNESGEELGILIANSYIRSAESLERIAIGLCILDNALYGRSLVIEDDHVNRAEAIMIYYMAVGERLIRKMFFEKEAVEIMSGKKKVVFDENILKEYLSRDNLSSRERRAKEVASVFGVHPKTISRMCSKFNIDLKIST